MDRLGVTVVGAGWAIGGLLYGAAVLAQAPAPKLPGGPRSAASTPLVSTPVPSAEQGALIRVDAAQRAALGIALAAVKPAVSMQWQAKALVVAPYGKEVVVSAPYPGQLTQSFVGQGERVRAGDRLGRFVSAQAGEARRQLEETRIEARLMQAGLDRERALFEDGVIPEVRLQLAQAKHESAQAALRAREAELQAAGLKFDPAPRSGQYANGILIAPAAGVVLELMGPIGQRVEAGATLYRLADDRQLQLDLQLANDKAAQLQLGDRVQIPQRRASAVITGVSRAVDASQLARARALVQQRGSLQVGEALSVSVETRFQGEASRPVWQVPARALSQVAGRPIAFVAASGGFRVVTLELLANDDDQAVVAGALDAQSQVAVTGVAGLRALLQSN